jgi:large subunit ribosomal protein L30
LGKMLKITWDRSTIGQVKSQRATIRSLGLKKLNQTVIKEDTPQIRGMISRVRHLVTVEEV